MPASGGNLGVTGHSTNANSFTHTTTTSAIASGEQALLILGTDNISTADGATNDHVSVTGGNGVWEKLGEYTNAPSAAAAVGATVSLWLFRANANNAIGTVFTFNFSANLTDKTASMWRFTVGAGKKLALTTGTTNPITSEVTAANDFGSSAFTGLPSVSRLYFRGLAKEANSTTQITVSSNFNATTVVRSRNNANAILGRGEWRINTSTGETSNPALAVSGDTAGLFVALEEVDESTTTPQSVPATAVGVATLALAPIFAVAAGATAVGVPTLARLVTFSRTLGVTAIGVATLTRVATFFRTLSVVATVVPTLTKGMFKTLAPVAVGVATLSAGLLFLQNLGATAVGVGTLSAVFTIGKTIAATAVGVATLTAQGVIGKLIGAVAIGVVSLVAQFIAGSGGGFIARLRSHRHHRRR